MFSPRFSLACLAFLPLLLAFGAPTTYYSPTSDGTFICTGCTYFHNRPLYGAHNGGLVLSGDLPIFHVTDDNRRFGGFLFGLVYTGTGQGKWSHSFSNTTTVYEGGSVRWTLTDATFPGVTLSARTLPVAAGFGALLDVNITTTTSPLPGGNVTLVWSFGCGLNVPGQRQGWANDPLINPQVLQWTFSPNECKNNRVTLRSSTGYDYDFPVGSKFTKVSVDVQEVVSSTPSSTSSTTSIADASTWEKIGQLNATTHFPSSSSSSSSSSPTVPTLPISNPSLWLSPQSLGGLSEGEKVAQWLDSSSSATHVTQTQPGRQPYFSATALGPASPGVVFDGVGTWLSNAVSAGGSNSTMFVVFRDMGSSGGSDGPCCSGVLWYNVSFTGVSTLAGSASAVDDDSDTDKVVLTKLDWPGSDSNGHVNVYNRTVVGTSLYPPGGKASQFYVDSCPQQDTPRDLNVIGGVGVFVGTRNDEMGRFFKGGVGEVVVFPWALSDTELAAMQAYFIAAWPAMHPKTPCTKPTQPLPLGVGRTLLPTASSSSATTTRLVFSVAVDVPAPPAPSPPLPFDLLLAGEARVSRLRTGGVVSSPDPLIAAATTSLSLAVDGLYRDNPGIFVHGAMAWDEPYVGWRSEYGGTVFGWLPLVYAEGLYVFSLQNKAEPEPGKGDVCRSDPGLLYTQESASSRLYGKGRILSSMQSFYDMQTQFFDQQIHVWRWGGGASHPNQTAFLEALALHVEWATECFDAEGSGLFQSYINTWPTDSQWYNGGKTYEETAYMYLAHKALRDAALIAGDGAGVATHNAALTLIRGAIPSLWIQDKGHPASHREEGGHRRLRPDPWLYSVFLPIEAGLFTMEEAAQALYYSEWALQRDPVPCPSGLHSSGLGSGGGEGEGECGQVVWTSNWVPSQWSVRQLWPGDNFALAQAYFTAGLGDDGYNVLAGSLTSGMILSGVPGNTGKSNGGEDFNDAVHPAARSIVEGLFGYRPDYITGVVVISPAFPTSWGHATLTTSDVAIAYNSSSVGTLPTSFTLSATLTKHVTPTTPPLTLVLRTPLRGVLDPASVVVSSTSAPPASPPHPYNYTIEAGFGESVLVVSVTLQGGVLGAGVVFSVTDPLPATPSIFISGVSLGEGLTLPSPPGFQLYNFSDPQGVFSPGSGSVAPGGGSIQGTVTSNATYLGSHMVFGYGWMAASSRTPTPHPVVLMFKLNITGGGPPPPSPIPPPTPTTKWVFATNLSFNGDLRAIYTPNTYLSPRPETCGVRIGSDGWSAWTFPYWGSKTPPVDFSLIPGLSPPGNPSGVITTPQGAQFFLPPTTTTPGNNVLFASLWDNYPAVVSVEAPSPIPPTTPPPSVVWVLVAGSTNPMQTLFPNAALRFNFTGGGGGGGGGGDVVTLELIPPMNFWAMSGWGNADYSYLTDAWCLPPTPPPTCTLGKNLRAMVYSLAIPPGSTLASVELEVLSQEVVIGILAVSLSS